MEMKDLEEQLKQSVAETGKILIEKKLVARTWGNISCRIDETHFAITPSGLGYENLTSADIPVFDMENETWQGNRKPSSEKKIHAACYKTFSDAEFVIHTHQDYATAIGLVGTENLEMFEEEKNLLGEIRIAAYGLPGTKKLKNNVENELKKGSKIILMVHHGAVIVGKNRENAINKAEVLEKVCKRAYERKTSYLFTEEAKKNDGNQNLSFSAAALLSNIQKVYKNVVVLENPLMQKLAENGSFKAQTDDMAQMLGGKLRCVSADSKKVMRILAKQDAVLVKKVGCVIKANDTDDVKALELLVEKAAFSKLYTLACNKKINLDGFDCALMRFVYKNKYSKKKNDNGNKPESATVKSSSKEWVRVLKFVGFSISAGVIELLSFTLLNEIAKLPYWTSYLIALVLSVVWNFTFNRKFTFKAANNVPIAMLKVAAFYAVFTPLTTWLEKYLTGLGWNEYLVTLINMGLNLTTEYVYDRFVVFRKSIDTNTKNK